MSESSSSDTLMTAYEAIRLSKLMSYVLRHGAIKEKLHIRPDGYVRLADLLARPKFKGVTEEQIMHVVETNSKQRYKLARLDNDEWYIRANQGHSIKNLNENLIHELLTAPPPVVIHGTTHEAWESIKIQGLSKMERNHVHLATGLPDERGVISGVRMSSTVFIYLDAAKAMKDGIQFYRSSNGVILTEGKDGIIAPKYFVKAVDLQGQSLL
ncbi:phosphotransferase KptA/Tpt1 [Dichotomocladium elegans]|nr:phosphotransferase KptA/Tpt1 [Dichotomocladium elegans]